MGSRSSNRCLAQLGQVDTVLEQPLQASGTPRAVGVEGTSRCMYRWHRVCGIHALPGCPHRTALHHWLLRGWMGTCGDSAALSHIPTQHRVVRSPPQTHT